MTNTVEPSPKKAKTSASLRDGFMAVYDQLKAEIVADLDSLSMPEATKKYIARMVDYNVPGGKLNRGLTVASVVQSMHIGKAVPEDTIVKAHMLGWCIEWLQAFFLVADDVMDASITRRGQPCWYKLPEVGLNAVNDSIILEAHIFHILRRHFKTHPAYVTLMELFMDVTYRTEIGQLLDLTSQEKDVVDLDKFTLDTYKRIVKYKTAFYSFYLPVACGMILSGVADEAHLKLAEEICLDMGEYFQIQDDVLDCYGAPEVIGKIGTDIQDNKCSWLVVTALSKASAEQKAILKANYAKHDPACVAKVKEVYAALDLKSVFNEYESESYARISERINKITNVPHAVFTDLLAKIYKRQK
eukprot:tig00000852_g5057.t1